MGERKTAKPDCEWLPLLPRQVHALRAWRSHFFQARLRNIAKLSVWRSVRPASLFGPMDEFIDWLRRCFRRAELPQTWGKVVNFLTLVLGWIFVWLVYNNPDWTGTRQAWYGVLCVIVIPIGAATVVMGCRVLLAPFWVHQDAVATHANEITGLKADLEVKSQMLDQRRFHREIREQLSSFLTAGDKIKRRANDGQISSEEADKWYGEVATYIRMKLGSADKNLFISDTNIPLHPFSAESLQSRFGAFNATEAAKEAIRVTTMMHNRCYQLRKILDEMPREI